MANGKVDDLSWSQLRPRRAVPQCVIDSIPPEDMQAFLRLIATNPFLPFTESSAVRRKIASLRQWRAETANPNTVTKEFSIVRTSDKRKREDDFALALDSAFEGGRETDSEEDQPKRKQRRSSRPAMTSVVERLGEGGSPEESRGTPPKIGSEFQAEVPASPLPSKYWAKYPPVATSKLVYSEEACGGTRIVNVFLNDVNKDIRRRDGFELAPFARELALQLFFANKGAYVTAKKSTLEKIPRGPYFPGIKAHFRYEEQCLFVRALAERTKNFRQISREDLPERTTSELVWLYYTRHKQLWIQNGGMKDGLVLDDGGEKLKRVQLTTERTISALRSLAITAGDGYPIDSRVNLAVLACRRGNVIRRRRQRDEENLQRGSRLRNLQNP